MPNTKKKILAQAKLPSLDKTVMQQGYELIRNGAETSELLQSHYYVAGSFQDKVSRVSSAFDKYLRVRRLNSDDDWNSWGYVLSIMETEVIFYIYDGWDGCKYFSVSYSDDGKNITFGDCTSVDVNLVVDYMKETMSTEQSTQSEETEAAKVDQSVAPINNDAPKVVETIEQAIANRFGEKKEDYLLQARIPSVKIVNQTIETQGEIKVIRVKGTATIADIINLNQVVFPVSVWEANLERMNQAATEGRFTGAVEHPKNPSGLKDVVLKFEPKFELDQSVLTFEALVLPTEPDGKNLQILIESGVNVDMSTRGYGSTKDDTFQGKKVKVVQDDFVCTHIDTVEFGAAPGSSITEVVEQGAIGAETEGTTLNQGVNNTMTEEEKKAAELAAQAQKEKELSQSATAKTATPEPINQAEVDARKWADAQNVKQLFVGAKAAVLTQGAEQLSAIGLTALQAALDMVPADDLVRLQAKSEEMLPFLVKTFAKANENPGSITQGEQSEWGGHFIPKTAAENAPKNGAEYIERLLETVPDRELIQGLPGKQNEKFATLRGVMRSVMYNIAQMRVRGFDGPLALKGALLQEARRHDDARETLLQSALYQTTDAATAVVAGNANGDPGGAPITNYLIFPLVTRVFPALIMQELANIQPMDRPDGKIFYLDQYRVGDPSGTTTKRIDLNTSANPFNSSFANSSSELSAVKRVSFALQSVAVRATPKKLAGSYSEELAQDLRAYHGLEAASLLLDGMGREIANERNVEFLNLLLANASAASLTYGTTMPSTGYSQNEWDEYLWVYLQKLNNSVMSYRQAGITHIVCGLDAALAFTKPMRGGFSFVNAPGGSFEMNQYPGATFLGQLNTPGMGGLRVFASTFWNMGTTNGSKILGLRRGPSFGDCPAIFSPYTFYQSPNIMDPNDLGWTQGVMERSAMKSVIPEAAGTITVSNTQGAVIN